MKDYYIGESAPNSSYDNNMDDMSLNIILPNSSGDCRSPSELVVQRLSAPLPKTIVKKRMKDSVVSTVSVVKRLQGTEAPCQLGKLGKPFESKKYTVTELAELYKPSVQRTVILSPTSSSVELDANNNSNTLSECITHDSMDDLRISSNKTYPVTNELQSPTKFDQGVVCIHHLIRTVSLSKRETKNTSDTSGQTSPVALPPSKLVVKEAFSPPCQTSPVTSGKGAVSLSTTNSEGDCRSPEESGQIEVSTYVKIHWYNKLNFTFIGPILDKYRKRKITPEN